RRHGRGGTPLYVSEGGGGCFMKTRAIAVWGAVTVAALMTGCADRRESFSRESQAPVVKAHVVVESPPPVVIQPGQQVVVGAPQTQTVVTSNSQIVQADDLVANEVRAQTIYANKIRAPEIRGAIHQTGEVKIDHSVRDLKAPTVVASVIYADTITAHRV